MKSLKQYLRENEEEKEEEKKEEENEEESKSDRSAVIRGKRKGREERSGTKVSKSDLSDSNLGLEKGYNVMISNSNAIVIDNYGATVKKDDKMEIIDIRDINPGLEEITKIIFDQYKDKEGKKLNLHLELTWRFNFSDEYVTRYDNDVLTFARFSLDELKNKLKAIEYGQFKMIKIIVHPQLKSVVKTESLKLANDIPLSLINYCENYDINKGNKFRPLLFISSICKIILSLSSSDKFVFNLFFIR